MGSTPEHENDFSVPRTSMGINLDSLMQFVNPMNWVKRSGFAKLMVSNLVASPLISAVMLMKREMSTGMMGIDTAEIQMLGMATFGHQKVWSDVQFMADELKFFGNNQILMYSPALSYFHHTTSKYA